MRLLRQMLRVRRFEEKCVELYSGAKIRGFMHLCIGEEAVAVGVLEALGPQDAIVATYREHGHALVRGVPAGAVMAEMGGEGRSRAACARRWGRRTRSSPPTVSTVTRSSGGCRPAP